MPQVLLDQTESLVGVCYPDIWNNIENHGAYHKQKKTYSDIMVTKIIRVHGIESTIVP